MHRILIATAVLSGVALAVALVRRQLKRTKCGDESHWAAMRETLGIKPGVGVALPGNDTGGAGAQNPGSKPEAQKGGNPAQKGGNPAQEGAKPADPPGKTPDKKGPGTALMVLHDANGLKVNGEWLKIMNRTVVPEPIHASRTAVDQAVVTARRSVNACNAARTRHAREEAEKHLEAAIAVVNSSLRVDHWFIPEVLNQLGCLRYELGHYTEAREIWWRAQEIAAEWPERCQYMEKTLADNIELARKQLGF